MGTARNVKAVTPHNTTALNPIPTALYVGTGGDVVLRARGDSTDVTFSNVPDGSHIFVEAQYVRATNTTASDILALIV